MNDKYISLDLSSSAVLSVVRGEIYLRAHIMDGDAEDECVAIVPPGLYHEAWQKFLGQKAEYFKNWNEFCGSEWVISDEYEPVARVNLLSHEDWKCRPVPTFRLLSIHVEMEHG